MKKIFLAIILSCFSTLLFAQQNFTGGTIHGSFQTDFQLYQKDKGIGINDLKGKVTGMNSFGNVLYENGKFTAGLRFESYLPPLNGYETDYDGYGISNRFIKYSEDWMEITAGNFYEQFGNGLIFRSYEEWSLGFDNSTDGALLKIKPAPGIIIKGIYGVQRNYWQSYQDQKRGIVRGGDAEFNLNEMVSSLNNSKTIVTFGGSFISKFEKSDPFSSYKLPENVAAYAARLNIHHGGFSLQSEYAQKINDPNNINNYIYKKGEALWVTANYSQKGFGVIVSGKRIDNFNYTAMRSPNGKAATINFLPPLTYQHTYTLLALYPYSTQPNGEMGASAEVFYSFPKKSLLGGKYGTKISANYSRVHGIDKKKIDDNTDIGQEYTDGYTSDFFTFGDNLYFEDFSFNLSKRVTRSFNFNAGYTHIKYNYDVVNKNIENGKKMIYAHMGFLDMTYKFNRKNALRTELQYLATKQDSGHWALAMFEYSIAPKWFFTVQDQFNFNNPISNNTYHYYTFGVAYIQKTTRLAVQYGRQREGILCVGGICRQVPASSGLTVTLTSSF